MPDAAQPLPRESPTLETERTFPQPPEVNGDNVSVNTANDRLESAFETKQLSGPADGSLGENAKYMTALQLAARLLNGSRRAVRPCPDGDRFPNPQSPIQQLVVVIGLPHQEPDNRAQAGADQKSIQVGEVIGNQQSRSTRWDMFRAENANAEQGPRHHLESQPDQKVGKPRCIHWLDTFRRALRSHSALVPSSITVTQSAGRESMAAETMAFGTGTKPILQANSSTDRARVMVSNSR